MIRRVTKIILASIITFIIFCESAWAQVSRTNRLMTVHHSNSKIIIYGMLDEEAWLGSTLAHSFINKWPTDSGKAKLQTEIRVIYDDQFIYFGVKAWLE